MTKRTAGCTAVAIAASLMLGSVSTAAAATTTTLAGYGFNKQTETEEAQTQSETAAETEKAQTEAVSQAETVETDTTSQSESAETDSTASDTDTAQAQEESAEEESAQADDAASEETASVNAEDAQTEESQTEEAQTEPDRSMVDTTGFATTDSYINVRAEGDSDSEVLGTLTNYDSVYIEDVDENGWYKIRSGNLEGYVAGYLIATGDEAQAVADSSGYTYATVGAETVNVRSDASEDSEVVDMAAQGAELEVVEDLGDWVKVVTPDGIYGYVSADYTDTQTVYATGETVQEQSEREEAEYEAALAQQQAEYEAAVAQQQAEAQAQEEQQAAEATEMVSTMGSDVEALYQTYLEAQDAAMTATDENDAQTKADAAVAAYNAYIAAANGTSVSSEAGESQTAEAQYTDTQASQTASETQDSYTYESTDTSTDTSAASSSDVDALYQAYLTAQEAAMSPVDEADATAKANAAIDAYNAYLAAAGSSETVVSVTTTETAAADTTQTTADTSSADSTAADTASYTESTEQTQTEAPQTEASSSSSLGQQIADYAVQFVGNPYVYGGASLTGGADCSGFTMAVFAHFGIGLPHNAAAQSGCGTQVSLSDLQPGDLLFYDNGGGIGHVTLYIGGGQVVHASNPESGIKISAYNYRTPVCAVRCW